MDFLADLTPAQRRAVTHMEGPLLLLAGPGSGKTRVITRRVAHLLHQGVRPWNLLAITFTNKAAQEMRRRVAELVPGQRLWVSTFHSLGAKLLRGYATRLDLDANFTIYDQDDRKQVIKECLGEANLDSTHFSPERIQAAISKAKNLLQTPPQYAKTATDFFGQNVARVYPLYEKRMRERSALDFDDLLVWVARMLTAPETADIRAELDARFQYVLVDEYQDTNLAQYKIVRALSVDHPNLCVVGDPDQSIYRWRGADIRNILEFERDFPDATLIRLEENFRSTAAVLRAAGELIEHNSQRKAKRLVAVHDEGRPVAVVTHGSGYAEADWIAAKIADDVRAGRRRFRDFAVLMRINALSRSVELALMKARVPYQVVRGLAFFERKENKDILGYLRLLMNPKDDLSFLRIVNEPARGIGKTSLEQLKQYAQPRELGLLAAVAEAHRIEALRPKTAKALTDFAQLMRELSALADQPADEVIRQVIDRSGYRKMLLESRDEDDASRLANIEELISAAHQFAREDSANTLQSFLEHISLVSDQDAYNQDQDQVAIMTLHAAKGLEFPVVFIIAVEERMLPHERSKEDPAELEEERRLAFVGMTRAEEELYLTLAKMREFRGQASYIIPSSFLEELPTEGVERVDLAGDRFDSSERYERYLDDDEEDTPIGRSSFQRGQRTAARKSDGFDAPLPPPKDAPRVGTLVRHSAYGVGKVLEISGYGAMRRIKITFSEGVKTFVLDKAALEIVKK
jgi:DNA helicase-2/ATP-dependent DNA helicase PcrA